MRRTKNTFFVLFLFTFALAPAGVFSATLVNINTASLAELETLNGVGPVTAQSIIDNRPYASIEEVSRASGIGDPGSASYEKIKDYITVGDTNTQTQTQTQTQTAASADTAPPPAVSMNGNPPAPITAAIEAPPAVVAGGGTYFVGRAYGSQNLPLSSARFSWNFGDGTTAEGQKVFHTYAYPGSYLVVLTVANNLSTASDRLVVGAVAAQAGLVVQNDGSVTVANKSGQDLDLGLWKISCGGETFVLPEGTVALAQGGIRFAPAVLKFSCGTDAKLLYPNGSPVADASLAANSPLRGEQMSPAQVRALAAPPKGQNLSSPIAAPAGADVAAAREDLAAVPAEAGVPSWALYGIGLAALIILGASAAWYARAEAVGAAKQEETTPSAEEFDIYE